MEDFKGIQQDFESWGEFLSYLELNAKVKGQYSASTEINSWRTTWSGTKSLDEALELARYGWEKGTKLTAKYANVIVDRIGHLIDRPDPVWDVEGGELDIGRFLSGEPDCWVRMETDINEPSGRILRVMFNISVSAGVDTNVITAKGAACLALVELLELAGNRCEFWLCDIGPTHRLHIKIKDASQPADLPRLAFVMAHPSMERRIEFRWQEIRFVEEDKRSLHSVGYGMPMDSPRRDNCDVYIGKALLGEPQWTDTDEAVKWVKQQLLAQGVALDDEELPTPPPAEVKPRWERLAPPPRRSTGLAKQGKRLHNRRELDV